MLFNSFHFFFFFIIVGFGYFMIPATKKWIWLLCGSYYFYMCWNPAYILLIVFSSLIAYVAGIFMEKYEAYRKLIAIVASMISFSFLIYFKYLNFLVDTVENFINMIPLFPQVEWPLIDILLPVGISFLTFQNVGYIIDVYRRKVKVEHHFGYLALFGSYFPQLVAGPIERTANLLPQLKVAHSFDYDRVVTGLRLMLIGLFKKVAVADTIAHYVDNVYNNLDSYAGLPLILATVLFAFQIYCDFSGYSDIAKGTSKILGIDLMQNFNSPYLASSIGEFWHRWHISLSTWFRDNVYIPLGGSRTTRIKHYRNLLITFSVSGLWHGADWSFLVWGGGHGIFLCIEAALKNTKLYLINNRFVNILRIVLTFIMVDLIWVFFRADNISDALYLYAHMFSGIEFSMLYLKNSLITMGFTKLTVLAAPMLVGILIILDILNNKKALEVRIGTFKTPARWAIYFGFVLITLAGFMFTSNSQNFIYFQF